MWQTGRGNRLILMDGDTPRRDLEGALEQLEQFSQLVDMPSFNPSEPLSSLNDSPPTSFKRIIKLAHRVVGIFSSSEKSPTDFIDQVRISGDIVKSYFPLIHLLEDGDPHQQKFARDVKEVVNRFNCAIDCYTNRFPHWGKRIARFLYSQGSMMIGDRLAKIELPAPASKQIHFSQFQVLPSVIDKEYNQHQYQEGGPVASQKISALCQAAMPMAKPATQTMELYLMKVISLLEKSGLMTNSEAREIVRNSDFHTSLDKEHHVLTISQTLVPMPGQTIEVTGAFKRDARTMLFNIFLPDTCHLSTNSKQSGFPHALQRHGWALSEALIPICLPECEKGSIYSGLHAAKKKFALDLLPGGSLSLRARILLKMKKQAFENEFHLFLQLHRDLAIALCGVAGLSLNENILKVIESFFAILYKQPNAYEFLSRINHDIMQGCAGLPQKAILKAHATSKISLGIAGSELEKILEEGYEKAIRDMAEKYEDQSACDYVLLMGSVMAPPSRQIILQSYSDICHFKVVAMDHFASKVQTALYLQLHDFHHELAVAPNQIDMAMRMRRLLEDDIALFRKAP